MRHASLMWTCQSSSVEVMTKIEVNDIISGIFMRSLRFRFDSAINSIAVGGSWIRSKLSDYIFKIMTRCVYETIFVP